MKKQWHIDNAIDCPLVAAINIVGGKWKPIILHMLAEETMRFGELKRNIPPISQKMLTQQLRELEADGIVHRELYPEKPPRTEYSLTARGASLRPILQSLYAWGQEQAITLHRDQARNDEPKSIGNAKLGPQDHVNADQER